MAIRRGSGWRVSGAARGTIHSGWPARKPRRPRAPMRAETSLEGLHQSVEETRTMGRLPGTLSLSGPVLSHLWGVLGGPAGRAGHPKGRSGAVDALGLRRLSGLFRRGVADASTARTARGTLIPVVGRVAADRLPAGSDRAGKRQPLRSRAVGSVAVRAGLDRAGGLRRPLTALRPQRAGRVTRRAVAQRRTAQPLTRPAREGYPGFLG